MARPEDGGTGLHSDLPARDPPMGGSFLQEAPENLGHLGSATNNAEARDSRLRILRYAPGRLESRPQPLKPRLKLMGNSPRLESRPPPLQPRLDMMRNTPKLESRPLSPGPRLGKIRDILRPGTCPPSLDRPTPRLESRQPSHDSRLSGMGGTPENKSKSLPQARDLCLKLLRGVKGGRKPNTHV